MSYGIGERIVALEKFFNVKKPKDMNELDWLEKLHEMELDWEEQNQKEFPI